MQIGRILGVLHFVVWKNTGPEGARCEEKTYSVSSNLLHYGPVRTEIVSCGAPTIICVSHSVKINEIANVSEKSALRNTSSPEMINQNLRFCAENLLY